MGKTAAQRQKRYRDKQRNSQEAMAKAAGVTAVSDYGVDRNAQRAENVTRVTVDVRNVTVRALRYPCRLDYHLNQQDYASRAIPDRLNWGPWMNSTQLEQAGLKANRVSIPGDWDYEAVTE